MKEVAVGILINDGRVLACQRKKEGRYPLKWEFPGGKIEAGETAQNALVRELREELGVLAVPGRALHRQEWVYEEGKDGSAFRVFYFLMESFTGTPTNNAFEQIKWVTPGQLLTMDILEGNREAISLLLKHVHSRHTQEPAPGPQKVTDHTTR
jgi:mutator protein MutT